MRSTLATSSQHFEVNKYQFAHVETDTILFDECAKSSETLCGILFVDFNNSSVDVRAFANDCVCVGSCLSLHSEVASHLQLRCSFSSFKRCLRASMSVKAWQCSFVIPFAIQGIMNENAKILWRWQKEEKWFKILHKSYLLRLNYYLQWTMSITRLLTDGGIPFDAMHK